MTFFELLFEIYKNNSSIAGIILYVAACAAFVTLAEKAGWMKDVKENLRLVRWQVIFGIVISIHICSILFVSNRVLPKVYYGYVLLADVIVSVAGYLYLKYVPSKMMRRMKRIVEEKRMDKVAVYQALSDVDQRKLTKAEQRYWKRQYGYVLYNLGSVDKALAFMKETEEENTAWYDMFLSLHDEAKGDFEQCEMHLKQAYAESERCEDSVKIQILNNYGRLCRIAGNNEEAWKRYSDAANLLTPGMDSLLIQIVYSNLIMQSCVTKRADILQQLLDEYKGYLNFNKVEDFIDYQNVELVVARQLEDNVKIREIIEQGYDTGMKKLRTQENWEKRLHFEVTTLRIAHMAKLELRQYLEDIRADLALFGQLAMPQRYYLLKEIHICYGMPPFLEPDFVEEYSDVFDLADNYMVEEAKTDLEQYILDLPDVAVYEYCSAQMEIALLEKLKENYCFDEFYERARNVRDTYERNELRLSAMHQSISIADEILSIYNSNQFCDILHERQLREALGYADQIASNIKYHPAYADAFLKLSFGYIRLEEYELGLKYYRAFMECNIGMKHFGNGLDGNLKFIRLVLDVYEYDKLLKELKTNDKEKFKLSERAREWIEAYPLHTSNEDTTLLFGGLLKREPVLAKYVEYTQNINGEPKRKKHFWLCYAPMPTEDYRQSVIEIDMRMDELSEEPTPGYKLFFPNCHPLQSGQSDWLHKHVVKTKEHPVCIGFPRTIFPEKMPGSTQISYLAEIRNVLWSMRSLESDK